MTNPDISTKIMEIHSKYTFINETTSNIEINQNLCSNRTIICPSKSTIFFSWPDKDKAKTISIKFPGAMPSDYFSIEDLGLIVQQLVGVKFTYAGIVCIERYMNKGVHYIKFFNEVADRPYYLIKNCSRFLTIGYKEECSSLPTRYLDCNTQSAFGWEHTDSQHIIHINFLLGKANENPLLIPDSEKEISMEDIVNYGDLNIKLTKNRGKCVNVYLDTDGHSKILCIRDSKKEFCGQKTTQKKVHYSLGIKELGISFISKQEKESIELCFLTLGSVDADLDEENSQRNIKLSLQTLKIDNQSERKPIFPVCFYPSAIETPTNFLTITCKSPIDDERKSLIYIFDEIGLQIVPITLKIEEKHLEQLREFFDLWNSGDLKDFSEEKKQDEATVLIKNCLISSIEIVASYKPSAEKKKGSMLAKSLQLAFLNIQELNITLNKEHFDNIQGKIKELAIFVLDRYQNQLYNQRVGLVTGILFSPLKDVQNIGIGISRLFSSPEAKTHKKGRDGIAKSAWMSTFGTVSSLTSGISKGVLALSTDNEYINKKQEEERLHQPKNVLEGIGLGVFSVAKSIGSGVAGVVTKPIKGAQQDGMLGLVKVNIIIYATKIGIWQRIRWVSYKTN